MTVPSASETVRVEKRKHPAIVRTTFDAYVLGSDHWGEWLSVPDQRALLLLPHGEWWVAWFRHDGSARVDIATNVVAGGGQRSFVDLDLDIERDPDGSVRILDEDQFAERCGAYPPAWIPAARRVLGEVADRMRRGDEPFGRVHEAWAPVAGWAETLIA